MRSGQPPSCLPAWHGAVGAAATMGARRAWRSATSTSPTATASELLLGQLNHPPNHVPADCAALARRQIPPVPVGRGGDADLGCHLVLELIKRGSRAPHERATGLAALGHLHCHLLAIAGRSLCRTSGCRCWSKAESRTTPAPVTGDRTQPLLGGRNHSGGRDTREARSRPTPPVCA